METHTVDKYIDLNLSPAQKVMKKYHNRKEGRTFRRMADELSEPIGVKIFSHAILQYWESGLRTPRNRRFALEIVKSKTSRLDWRYQFCMDMLEALDSMTEPVEAIVVPE